MSNICVKVTEVHTNNLFGDARRVYEVPKYVNVEGYVSHWGKAEHDTAWPDYAGSCMIFMFKKEPTFVKESPEEIAALLNG